MEKGIFYPVSTGPGSAEMLTLQAVRILRECEIIFFPESEKNTLALDSISQISGLDLSKKTLLPCHFSMTADKEKSAAEYEKIARECQSFLNEGKSVAMLSIGDVSLYSTAARTAIMIQSQGFDVKFIPGVNSFSAAASSALISLCDRDEKLTIIPGDAFFSQGKLKSALEDEGTKVLMKMGRHLKEIISILDELGMIQNATLIQKASLPDEKIFRGKAIAVMTEEDLKASYLSVMIVK